MSRAITLASIKNALEEIGNNDEDSNYEKPATRPCNNPFDSDIDDDTLKHSYNPKKEIREDETIRKRNIHAEKDTDDNSLDLVETLSNAPTIPLELESSRLDEVKIYSHIPGKRKAPEPPKRNGGAYYARIAKAMSPKINRPALSNATGVSSTEKGSGTTSVPFNELQKEKSPDPLHIKNLQQLPSSINAEKIDSNAIRQPEGSSGNSKTVLEKLVQNDNMKKSGIKEENRNDSAKVFSLKSSSPCKSHTRGIEKSFSEKSIYAQYCSNMSSKDDENIYEFVKTKSPSPAEVRSPKPWYKKSIGIFDKTKKSTAKSFNPASAVPVYPLTSSNQDDAKAKLVPNNIQPAVKTSTSKNDATALESFPKNYNAPSNPSQSQKYMVTSAIENAGTDKMSSNITSNNISPRPVSLLMSISDFDRQAAEIVSQRQKQEEAKQQALNDAFYISNESNASSEKNRMMKRGPKDVQKEPQEAIDEIMASVEKKMECLDEVEKHNDKWVHRMSANLDEANIKGGGAQQHLPKNNLLNGDDRNVNETSQGKKEKGTPSMEMKDLVSDLNTFLNTTQRELRTPKGKRKQSSNDMSGINQHETKENQPNKSPYAKLLKPQVDSDDVEWACAKCTLINAKTARICTICGASKNPPISVNSMDDDSRNQNNELNIFEVPDIDEEKMPAKGNVLDRVVQFTALQMCSKEKPQFANKVWIPTELTAAEEATAQVDDRAATAKISKTSNFIKDKENKLDEMILSEKERIKTADKSLLEKEERDAILAKWKKEHEERIKAREAHFRNAKPDNPAPQLDVIKIQEELLIEANRKLDEKLKKEESDILRKKQKAKIPSLDESNKSSEAKVKTLAQMETPVRDDSQNRTKQAAIKRLNVDIKPNVPSENIKMHSDDHRNITKNNVANGKVAEDVASTNMHGFALKMPSQFIDRTIHTTTLSPTGTLSDTLVKAMQLTSSEDSSDHEVVPSNEELRKLRLAYYRQSDDNFFPSSDPNKNNANGNRKSSEIDQNRESVKESRVVQVTKCKQKESHYQVPQSPPKRVPSEFFLKMKAQIPDNDNQSDLSLVQEKYEPIYCEVLPKALRNLQSNSSKHVKTEGEKEHAQGKTSEEATTKINEFKMGMEPSIPKNRNNARRQETLADSQMQPSYTNMQDAKDIMAIEGLKLSNNGSFQKVSLDAPKRPMRQKIKKSVSLDSDSRPQSRNNENIGISGKMGEYHEKYPTIVEERKLSVDNFVSNQNRMHQRAKTATPQPFHIISNNSDRARTVTPQPNWVGKEPNDDNQFEPIRDSQISCPSQQNQNLQSRANNKMRAEKSVSKRWSNCSFPDPLLEEANVSSSNSSLSYRTAPIYAEIPGT